MSNDYIYPDIFAVFNALKSKGWNGFRHSSCVEYIQFSDSKIIAVPIPMSPLYRGENEYHEICKPSLYRRGWTEIETLERELQLADFSKMLDLHPEVKGLKNGGLEVNHIGLAQHYGIETNLLDLTNSPLVAAFFATTEYDSLTDTYRPILHRVSQGVIYFFPVGGFDDLSPEPKIMPIGLEVLKRPGEQCAYCIQMNKNENLNTMSQGISYRFWHHPEASLKIWELTKEGKLFFPFDPITEKVRAMKKYKIFSTKSLEEVWSKMKPSFGSLETTRFELEKHGCSFIERLPFAYTPQEVQYLEEENHRKYSDG